MGKANLAKKILDVMNDLNYIQKDDHVKYGSTDYRAVSEGQVIKKIRPLLIKHGLAIIPAGIDGVTIDNKVTTAVFHYTIIDSQSGEEMDLCMIGSGHDHADKGAGKAATYAGKYALLKLFWIETGEDPDKKATEQIVEENKKSEGNTNEVPPGFDLPKKKQQDKIAETQADTEQLDALYNEALSLIEDGRDKNVISQDDFDRYAEKLKQRYQEKNISKLTAAIDVFKSMK
jgi:hypothetical protein